MSDSFREKRIDSGGRSGLLDGLFSQRTSTHTEDPAERASRTLRKDPGDLSSSLSAKGWVFIALGQHIPFHDARAHLLLQLLYLCLLHGFLIARAAPKGILGAG